MQPASAPALPSSRRRYATDSEAQAYADATGISSSASKRVSEFFKGLDSAGLRSSFLDGWVGRSDTNKASGATSYSLRGQSNMTLSGSPTRMRNGLYFDGVGATFNVSQYGLATIPTSTGARTLIVGHSADLDTPSATGQILQLQNGTTGTVLRVNQDGVNGQVLSYVANLRTIAPNGWSYRTAPLTFTCVKDDALAGASSLSHLRLPNSGVSYTRGTTQGEASHPLTKLRMCLYANGGLTTCYGVLQRLMSCWFLFSKALSASEETAFQGLLDSTILPRWHSVWEGDSISNDMTARFWQASNFFGANMDVKYVWAGGETLANMVSQLGGGTGLNTTNLACAWPTIAHIAGGTNDLISESRSVAALQADLSTLWAYARARGAKVHAMTIPASAGITAGRETDRQTINAWILSQTSQWDACTDRDAWALAATATRPYYNDTNLFRDGTHLNVNDGKGADLLCAQISTDLAAFIP